MFKFAGLMFSNYDAPQKKSKISVFFLKSTVVSASSFALVCAFGHFPHICCFGALHSRIISAETAVLCDTIGTRLQACRLVLPLRCLLVWLSLCVVLFTDGGDFKNKRKG